MNTLKFAVARPPQPTILTRPLLASRPTPFKSSTPTPPPPLQQPARRTFISPPTQTLTASRTLPYPSHAIYSIIADVSKYSTFLPYCKSSTVTRWSSPDSAGTKWPSEAELVVGWNSFEEAFRSRIYCVPGRIVEAVGGRTGTTLRAEDIRHHVDAEEEEKGGAGRGRALRDAGGEGNGILTHLLTRWTVRPFPYKPPPTGAGREVPREGGTDQQQQQHSPREHTEVSLAIEYQFSNPIYSAMSGAVADRVAGSMIEAFEGRVKEVLEGGSAVVGGIGKGRDSIVYRGEEP